MIYVGTLLKCQPNYSVHQTCRQDILSPQIPPLYPLSHRCQAPMHIWRTTSRCIPSSENCWLAAVSKCQWSTGVPWNCGDYTNFHQELHSDCSAAYWSHEERCRICIWRKRISCSQQVEETDTKLPSHPHYRLHLRQRSHPRSWHIIYCSGIHTDAAWKWQQAVSLKIQINLTQQLRGAILSSEVGAVQGIQGTERCEAVDYQSKEACGGSRCEVHQGYDQ